MENKINIAELLKDCPKGMELDCTKYSNVYFVGIDNCKKEPKIKLKIETFGTWCSELTLDKYGKESSHPNAKCMIFPKGKTTWEGFAPPCKFKDGDVISDSLGTCIFKGEGMIQGTVDYYCGVHGDYFNVKWKHEGHYGNIVDYRLATEEEKQKLFQAIKDNGYHWNSETKTLEKLPKFKVGNKIKYINGKNKDGVKEGIILSITNDTYDVAVTNDMGIFVPISEQDNWELVPHKFDVTTLKPFESRVLVRNSYNGFWQPTFWGIYEAEKANEHQYRNYLTTKGFFRHCIPYNDDTKHLLGTTDDCEEFYKTWE